MIRRLLTRLRLPLIVLACSCATSKPPCDSGTAATMAALCAIQVQQECVDKGIAEDDCPVLKECDEAADKRTTECSK